jgi:hypothetical protein
MALAMYKDSEFTLPHPPIPLAVFLVVEEAICAAWEVLRLHPPPGFSIATAGEVEVTTYLHEMLKDKIWNQGVVDGFDNELVRAVVRPEVRSYDGAHLSKRPDMLVELVDRPEGVRPSQDGMFIECKPVDGNHSLVAHYCDKGIQRFVCGDYAWSMTQAMMIGYVDSDEVPADRLAPALDDRQAVVLPIHAPTTCTFPSNGLPVAITEHGRTFCYVETGLQAPHIVLRHLWLRRN